MTLFLDTAYIIALESLDDQNHHSALEHWPGLSAPAWIGIRKRRLAPVVVRLYEDSEWSGIDLYLESLVKHGDALPVGFAS